MNMLSFDSSGLSGGVSSLVGCARVLESCSFALDFLSRLRRVVMLELSFLNCRHLVGVLFREDLSVLDRLDGGVVVVLVDLTVYGFGD